MEIYKTMQSPQTFDILSEVKSMVNKQNSPEPPKWEKIPQIMSLTHDTLLARRAPLQDILAVLEAVNISLTRKVHSHMWEWESADILKFGGKLAIIESRLEEAGDALIVHSSDEGTVNNLWPIFALVKEIWNDLFGKGYITND